MFAAEHGDIVTTPRGRGVVLKREGNRVRVEHEDGKINWLEVREVVPAGAVTSGNVAEPRPPPEQLQQAAHDDLIDITERAHALSLSGGDDVPRLFALPAVLLLRILCAVGVAGVLQLEACATPMAAYVDDSDLWTQLFRATFTEEAARACERRVDGDDAVVLPTRGAGARRTVCTLLRVPFLMWGARCLPQRAAEALEALDRAGGVVECDHHWPIALKPAQLAPAQLAPMWRAQPLAQLFVLLSELKLDEHLSDNLSVHAPHGQVRICLGARAPAVASPTEEPPTTYHTEVALVELCDAIRRGDTAAEAVAELVVQRAHATEPLSSLATTELLRRGSRACPTLRCVWASCRMASGALAPRTSRPTPSPHLPTPCAKAPKGSSPPPFATSSLAVLRARAGWLAGRRRCPGADRRWIRAASGGAATAGSSCARSPLTSAPASGRRRARTSESRRSRC